MTYSSSRSLYATRHTVSPATCSMMLGRVIPDCSSGFWGHCAQTRPPQPEPLRVFYRVACDEAVRFPSAADRLPAQTGAHVELCPNYQLDG